VNPTDYLICERCGDVVEVDPVTSSEDLAIVRLQNPDTNDFVPLCEDCYQKYLAWRVTVDIKPPN
jgi:hypothetical protein